MTVGDKGEREGDLSRDIETFADDIAIQPAIQIIKINQLIYFEKFFLLFRNITIISFFKFINFRQTLNADRNEK